MTLEHQMFFSRSDRPFKNPLSVIKLLLPSLNHLCYEEMRVHFCLISTWDYHIYFIGKAKYKWFKPHDIRKDQQKTPSQKHTFTHKTGCRINLLKENYTDCTNWWGHSQLLYSLSQQNELLFTSYLPSHVSKGLEVTHTAFAKQTQTDTHIHCHTDR